MGGTLVANDSAVCLKKDGFPASGLRGFYKYHSQWDLS
jgi:hypothetical protein